MILAGDIGGTKTELALIEPGRGVDDPVRQERFPSKDFNSLEAVLDKFLAGEEHPPTAASFGVAGPVIRQVVRTTNLPWTIDATAIGERFGISRVHLLNDLQAIATAVPHFSEDKLCTLNSGEPDPTGNIGVVAPGTGLGEAFLTWSGSGYTPWPSEGGHASFAPVTPEQLELLRYAERRFGHVSFERVCSGSGFPNIYDYIVASGLYEEPEWLSKELANARDRTPIIMTAGFERKAPICIAALDLFIAILAGVLGNMAVKIMSTGGLYLGGGIPPRILPRLQRPDFLDMVCYKGRFRDWLTRIPVHVILDSRAALHGAGWDAIEQDRQGGLS